MRKILIAVALIFAFLLFANQSMAEMYQWVDKNGVIHFSDTPPKSGKKVEVLENTGYKPPAKDKSSKNTKGKTGNKSKSGSEKYGKGNANGQRHHMVEIYTTSWSRDCVDAIAFLGAHRIKFKLYDIERDLVAMAKMKALGGHGVPFAIINRTKLRGFSKKSYKKALGIP